VSSKPETLFRRRVVKDLESLDKIAVFSVQQVSIRGTPDLLICLKGNFIALELKSEEGSPSPLQLYNIKRIERAFGQAFVVYPDNWGRIFDFLKSIGRKR